MNRPRREALSFANEAERLARRHRDRLGEETADRVLKAARAVADAAAGDDPERLSGALRLLQELFEKHFAFARKAVVREYAEAVAAAVLVTLLLRAFVVEAFRIPSTSMAPTLLAGDQILVNKLAYGPRIPFTTRRLVTLGAPRRGDVIVFQSPRQPGKEFVKRVVGLPGEVVEIRGGTVYLNGVPQPRAEAGEFSYQEQSESTGRWSSDTCLVFSETMAAGPIPRPASDAEQDREASWTAAAAQGVSTHQVLECRRPGVREREGPFGPVAPGHVFVLGDNRERSADSRGEGGWQVPLGSITGRATVVWWSWGGSSPLGGGGLRVERLFKRIE